MNQPYEHLPIKTILLKWLCRPRILADVPIEFTIGIIVRVLHHALLPANGSVQHRVIYNAKQVMQAEILANLHPKPGKQAVVLHVVMQLHGGGGSSGAKHQQRMLQQSALARYLLEQGFELQWVTKTVDSICTKFSMQRISSITSMPVGGPKFSALQKLMAEAALDMPAPKKPQTKKIPAGLPWTQPKKRTGEGGT